MATTQTTPQQGNTPRRRGRPRKQKHPDLWAFTPQPVTLERLHYLFTDFLETAPELSQTAMAYMLGLWVECDTGIFEAMKNTVAMQHVLEQGRDALLQSMESGLRVTYQKAQITRRLLGVKPLPELGLDDGEDDDE